MWIGSTPLFGLSLCRRRNREPSLAALSDATVGNIQADAQLLLSYLLYHIGMPMPESPLSLVLTIGGVSYLDLSLTTSLAAIGTGS